MRTQMIAALSMSLLAAGHAGCMVEDLPSGTGEDEVGRVALASDQSCPPSSCPHNTPYVHGLRIDELHYGQPGEPGVPNQRSEQGFLMLGFTAADGQEGRITIQDGELRATVGEGKVLAPEDVVGGRIRVDWQVPSQAPRLYDLIITQMDYVRSWTYDVRMVPAYTIIAHDLLLTVEDQPICKTDDGATTHAVLLANERYDVDTLRVREKVPVDGWFTIVCEHSALYEMRLAGYDPEIPAGERFHTEPHQRQATLRMITADYCGIGHPFTEVGRELRWQNQAGWYQHDLSQTSHEAIWGPDGALCLDQPRFVDRKEVEDQCFIEYCNHNTMTKLGGEWETWSLPVQTTP